MATADIDPVAGAAWCWALISTTLAGLVSVMLFWWARRDIRAEMES